MCNPTEITKYRQHFHCDQPHTILFITSQAVLVGLLNTRTKEMTIEIQKHGFPGYILDTKLIILFGPINVTSKIAIRCNVLLNSVIPSRISVN